MLLKIASVFALGLLILLAVANHGKAHKAASGMAYDSWCCSNNDCGVADIKWLGDGKLQATTRHGSAVFDLRRLPRHRIKPSTDGQYHACIVKFSAEKGRCIYLPGDT